MLGARYPVHIGVAHGAQSGARYRRGPRRHFSFDPSVGRLVGHCRLGELTAWIRKNNNAI